MVFAARDARTQRQLEKPASAWLSVLRGGPFRIALAFSSVVIVTSYVVFALVYAQFYSTNVLVIRSVLEDEVRHAASVPLDRLKRQLELRLTQDLRHIDFVGLFDADNKLVYGNISTDVVVPTDGKAHLITTTAALPQERQTEKAIFVAVRRPDGTRMVLGRGLVFVDELKAAMLQGFVKAIVPVVVVALLAGLVVSRRASRRLSQIQRAIRRVMEGDLYVRLPTRRRADDIDELVRAVNAMLDEIVRLLHQIKSVGDNIAHDLRAPLAVMRARLERGLAESSEALLRSLTEEALEDLSRAMTTVTALLRISELESGLRRSGFDDVDLTAVCRDAYDLYEPLAEAKGVKMSLTTPRNLTVRGDGDLLREALANLVDNAVKFTPAGGHVTVACGQDAALMSVCDDGPGIAESEREKIFKRFYRAKSTDSSPGYGLGLSLAATIFEMHGFTLRIGDNHPGARFDILPGDDIWPAAEGEGAAGP